MTFSEGDIGKAFKIELEKQKYRIIDEGYDRRVYSSSFKVYLNKQIQTHSRKFQKFWAERGLDLKEIPPAQPEIDMILVDDFGIMRAIEIKWIKKRKKRITPSYYLGVGQTLAYLSFGFKQVALWQCFDGESLTDNEIFEYNAALTKIRNPLHPFLCATYFKIDKDQTNKPRIQTRIFQSNRPSKWEDGIGIFLPKIGEYKMMWNCFNPFIKHISPVHQNINEQAHIIYEFLELQKSNLWSK